jgi:hypothetical protein
VAPRGLYGNASQERAAANRRYSASFLNLQGFVDRSRFRWCDRWQRGATIIQHRDVPYARINGLANVGSALPASVEAL